MIEIGQSSTSWLLLLLSLALLALLAFQVGVWDVSFVTVAFYIYYTFGQVLNYLLGNAIYFGTITYLIPQASFVFFLAVFGLVLGYSMLPTRRQFNLNHLTAYETRYAVLPFVFLLLTSYSAVIFALLGPQRLGLNKIEKIAIIGPSLHYNYLLIQLCAASLYLVVRSSKTNRRLYLINFGAYITYCLFMQERDFIFAIASILMLRAMLGEVRARVRPIIGGLSLLYGATYLFNLRSGAGPVSVSDVLNQGGSLFVVTTVLDLVPNHIPFMYGSTYLSALTNLLPGFLVGNRFNLATWFKEIYAPGGDSGYGFSLDAEAYLNFGYAMVPIVFVLLATAHRLILNRMDRTPFFSYLAIFYTASLMYAFRGESLQLMKASLYAIIFFFILQLTSKPAWRRASLATQRNVTVSARSELGR